MIDLLIIGGGPAGLLAAISATRGGGQVVLCEQCERTGIKLAATGGGRCNLTNTASPDEQMERFGRRGRFMQPALAELDSRGLRALLDGLGVPTHAPDGVHVFPVTHRAATVQTALDREVRRAGIGVRTNCRITGLWIDDGELRGAVAGEERLAARAVLIATGGLGRPDLGATGDGYHLAAAGHSIVTPLPAMVPLITKETWPGACRADTIGGAVLRTDLPGVRGVRAAGDLIFTRRGITGPVVWDLSGEIAHLLDRHEAVPLLLNVTGRRSEEDWQERMRAWRRGNTPRPLAGLLSDELPDSLARVFCDLLGVAPELSFVRLTGGQRARLARLLARTPLTATGTAGFGEAMVTRGGVSLKDVDPHTLQSRRLARLHFAGEVLDLDGPCGGYNLQWAFASGRLAGRAALLR